MSEYIEIHVEEGLLSQVVRELLALAESPNHVEVTHGVTGRVILAHTALAEVWFNKVTAEAEAKTEVDEAAEESEVSAEMPIEKVDTADTYTVAEILVPVKRGPGRPRKIQPAPSVSNDEES